jgi:hypothetical protein
LKKEQRFALYRLEMADKKYLEKEFTMKFKTNRRWFTSQDIEVFNMYGIEYNLIQEENNCILYETVECNFQWMEKVNALKQKTDKEKEQIQYTIYKTLLSSFWGACSTFSTLEFKEGVKPDISHEWYFKTHPFTGDKIYINPNQIYKYSCGIIKPFVLSYARLRLLKQIKKVEDKGMSVVYAHTDSIICNKCDNLFELGTDIGQFKLEKVGNVEIKNIASKFFY